MGAQEEGVKAMDPASTSAQDISELPASERPVPDDLELGAAHERDVARRASLAELRRQGAATTAAAPPLEQDPSSSSSGTIAYDPVAHTAAGTPTVEAASAAVQHEPTFGAAEEERDKASRASLRALESTMSLGAKQLQSAADQLARLLVSRRSSLPASTNVKLLNWCIDIACGHIRMVNSAVPRKEDRGRTTGYLQLAPKLAALTQAYHYFATALKRAKQYARRHHLPIRGFSDAEAELSLVFEKLEIERWQLLYHAFDPRNELQLTHRAIRDNLNAAYEVARALRRELAQDEAQVAGADLRLVLRHMEQVVLFDDQLKQLSDTGSRVRAMHKTLALRVSAELQNFEAELSKRPELRSIVANSEFEANLSVIARMAGDL